LAHVRDLDADKAHGIFRGFPSVNQSRCRTACEDLGQEIMSVKVLSFQCYKQVADFDLTGVRGDPLDETPRGSSS
jgi:hypothetical protein